MTRRASIAIAWLVLAAPLAAQPSFEQATKDLSSPDPKTRLLAARTLKDAASPDAAIPLAALLTDPRDDVQVEAIAAELNIFLADPVVSRRRVGLVIEVRNAIDAQPLFSLGPLAIGPSRVPPEVLSGLRMAIRDDNPRVGLEALYAFGVLGVAPTGSTRHELLAASGPELGSLIGSRDPAFRYAALRVIGRVFERRPDDDFSDGTAQAVGDAVVSGLNDRDRAIKTAAIEALAAMRYDRAVQALTDALQFYGHDDLGTAAFEALARIANPANAALFNTELTSKNGEWRVQAIEGLARLGDPRSLEVIRAATTRERSASVRLAVAFASAMLAEPSTESGAQLSPFVDALRKSRDRDLARQYLAELARRDSLLFAEPLRNPDPSVRADLLDALALGGSKAALPLVTSLAADTDARVSKAAQRAIARLGG